MCPAAVQQLHPVLVGMRLKSGVCSGRPQRPQKVVLSLLDSSKQPTTTTSAGRADDHQEGNRPSCWRLLLCFSHTPHRIPWDVETSFAQDNGLGGSPGPYYCILACEQWNSPLYCDSEHPQVSKARRLECRACCQRARVRVRASLAAVLGGAVSASGGGDLQRCLCLEEPCGCCLAAPVLCPLRTLAACRQPGARSRSWA